MKKLSRDQLRKIKAGDSNYPGECLTGGCSVVDGTGKTHYGACGTYIIPMPGRANPLAICECITDLGVYSPSSGGGVSHCQSPYS